MKFSKSAPFAAVVLFSAVLTACGWQFGPTYRLYVTSDGNGAVSPAGMITERNGTNIRISAIPHPGYHFVDWTVASGNASFANSTSSSTTVNLTGGSTFLHGGLYYATVVAHFASSAATPAFTSSVGGRADGTAS